MSSVNQNTFVELTNTVIRNFEGGYYHPDMKKKMSAADQKIVGDSGETMYGIDRKNGVNPLAKSPYWAEFWGIIDKAGARYKWKHYYMGGNLSAKLQSLASLIMYPWFDYLFNKHLSLSSQNIIANDPRLIIHFSYAAWNGEVWFKWFAQNFNKWVANGITDANKLTTDSLALRINSKTKPISNIGKKMASVIAAMETAGALKKKRIDWSGFDFAIYGITTPYF